MEKVTIEIDKTTLEKLQELSQLLDFMEEPKDYDPNYDDLILSMMRYINKKMKKPLIS